MNKVLGFFGLCTLKKARNVSMFLHKHYVKCVQNGVEKDFDRKPAVGAVYDSGVWWNENFDHCMKGAGNTDGVDITSEPKFKN